MKGQTPSAKIAATEQLQSRPIIRLTVNAARTDDDEEPVVVSLDDGLCKRFPKTVNCDRDPQILFDSCLAKAHQLLCGQQ